MANNTTTTQLVLKINDKEVQNSFLGISREVKKLELDLKKLTPGTEAYFNQLKKIDTAKTAFANFQKQQEAVTKEFVKMNSASAAHFNTLQTTGQAAVSKLDSSFKGFFTSLFSQATAFLGVSSIFSWIKSGIDKFEKSEMTTARLSNALKNLGGNYKDVQLLEGSIKKLTDKYTYLGKLDLTEAQKKLVTWGKISGKQIADLMPLIVDFAANARISIDEATEVIVKGVEGNARALKMYGINVKEAGTEAERFSLIQTELSKRVSGSADIFQNSAEGKIETYKKQIGGLQKQIGEQLMPVYEAFLDSSISVMKVIKQIDFSNIVKGISALAFVWLVYRAAVIGAAIDTAIHNTALLANMIIRNEETVAIGMNTTAELANGKVIKGNTILVYLLAGAKKVYAAATKTATFEVTLFNTAIRVTPLGIFLTILGAVTIAMIYFSNKTDVASDKIKLLRKNQEDYNEISKEANKNAASEISHLDLLYKKATDVTNSTKDRKQAVKDLKSEYPSYFQNIKDEIIMNGKAEESYNSLKEAIIASARATAARKKLEDRASDRLDRDEKLDNEINQETKLRNDIKSKGKGKKVLRLDGGDGKGFNVEIDNEDLLAGSRERLARKKKQKELNKKADDSEDAFLLKVIENNEKKSAILTKDRNSFKGGLKNTLDNTPKSDKSDKSPVDKTKERIDKLIDEEGKAKQQLLELQKKYDEEKLKSMEDSREKESIIEKNNHDYELAQIKKNNEDILAEIENLKKQKEKSKSKTEITKIDNLIIAKNSVINLNKNIAEQSEETHRFRLLKIKQKWDTKDFEDEVKKDQLELDRQKRVAKEEIDSIQTLQQAKAKIKEKLGDQYSDDEIKNISSISEAKKILEEKANQDLLKSSLNFLKKHKEKLEEFAKTFDPNSPEGKALAEKISQFSDKMAELQGGLKNPRKKGGGKKVEDWTDAEKSAMQTDILGFTAEQWQTAFDNLDTTAGKLKAVGMVFQAMSNLGSQFAELNKALGEKDLRRFEKQQDAKKKALLKQLNQGFITNEEYHKQLELLEQQTANKKAEMEYKQARADKIARMFAIVGNTAMGISSALAAPFPVNLTLPWIVGALGAVQLGIVAAQPLPERPSFAEGGFTPDISGNPDGTGEVPVGYYKLHRKEWVAPRWMRENPRTANVINWLESVRQGGKSNANSFAEGGNVDKTTVAVANPDLANPQNSTNPQMLFVLSQISDFLQYLKDNPLVAEMYATAENGKLFKKSIESYDNIRNRASGKSV